MKALSKMGIKMQKVEEDFLLTETIDPVFFETGMSPSIEEFNDLFEQSQSIIRNLKNSSSFENGQILTNLDSLQSLLQSYQYSFREMVIVTRNKGFKDYGVIGEMRDVIHKVENILKEDKNIQASYYMLMLRRHEKDYLLRKQLKYQDKFANTLSDFYSYIKNSSLNALKKQDLIENLNNYHSLFLRVIKYDKTLGIKNHAGIIDHIEITSLQIENKLSVLHDEFETLSKVRIQRSSIILFSFLIFFGIVIMLILFRISKEIVHSLNKLNKHISKLGKGKIPGFLQIKYNNEITDMISNINILTKNLGNTKKFAIEVGQGNLQTHINVFDNEGDIGGSLIEMRKQLLKVAEEREKNEKANRTRIFINDGMSRVNELLNHTNNSIDEMCHQLIAFLVKYIDANQGVIYLRKDEDLDYMVACGAYAYARHKFLDKTIHFGDGIAGTCALERETIYLTEIPENYINITSGLGDAPPRSIAVIPVIYEDNVSGVIEMAAFNEIEEHKIRFLEQASERLGLAVVTHQNSVKTMQLLEQTNQQRDELQAQEETLRQNLEELRVTQEAMNRKEETLNIKIKRLEEKNQYLERELNYLQMTKN
jgi:putative methionine-R-sulfoxide reductase with GAF domain